MSPRHQCDQGHSSPKKTPQDGPRHGEQPLSSLPGSPRGAARGSAGSPPPAHRRNAGTPREGHAGEPEPWKPNRSLAPARQTVGAGGISLPRTGICTRFSAGATVTLSREAGGGHNRGQRVRPGRGVLTSWRMSSSLGMMESSSTSSLRREGARGQEGHSRGTPAPGGETARGWVPAAPSPAPAGTGTGPAVTCPLHVTSRALPSPVLLPAPCQPPGKGTHLFWIRAMTCE